MQIQEMRDRDMEQREHRTGRDSTGKGRAERADKGRDRGVGRRVALYGLLLALAMVFSYVETLIPIYLGAPGVKLGLANLLTVTGLYTIGVRGTVQVNLARIVLAGWAFGNMFSIIYSLAGAALSLLLMLLCKKIGGFGIIGVSVIGGVGHNIGQLLIAAFVVKTFAVFTYLPVLLVAGTIAGALIGLLGGIVVERIRRYV